MLLQNISVPKFLESVYQIQSKHSRLMLQKSRFLKKLYGPFLWMGLNCLKAMEPLQGHSLLFTTISPAVTGNHFIKLGRMKN